MIHTTPRASFFKLMNDSAGGLFDLNHRTGLVKLKPGKTTADIDKIEVKRTAIPHTGEDNL